MGANVLKLENVSVYQKDIKILDEVTFEVGSGEFVYFIGKTGSGKSSLMRTIYADLPLKKGFIEVAGFNVHQIKNKEIPFLRRKLGIVFQDFQLLFDRSVNDNLMFVMKATGWKDKTKMNNALAAVLEQVDLKTKGHKMPHQLSGGEQQRLAIARALINNPVLILADEPTGNLDPATSAGIMELLMKIKESGTAVVMATHDYDTIRNFPGRLLHFTESTVKEIDNLEETGAEK
jgi:cell division transport system ATP-binding protein